MGRPLRALALRHLYFNYNNKISYTDGTDEDMNLQVLKIPQAGEEMPQYATQAGVGLCAYKTTEQKKEAVQIFAKWFLEETRNLNFAVRTGYMPVLNGAFEKIEHYNFSSDAQKNLYNTLFETKNNCTMAKESSNPDYWHNVYNLYSAVRNIQKDLKNMQNNGDTPDDIKGKLIEVFKNIK